MRIRLGRLNGMLYMLMPLFNILINTIDHLSISCALLKSRIVNVLSYKE